LLRVVGARGLQATFEIVRKAVEAEVQALDWALLDVQGVVHGKPVRPGLQAASEAELRQAGHDADEDLLRRVLGVLPVPQHPQGQAVDVTLEGPHQGVERLTIAVEGLPRDVFERRWSRHLKPVGRCSPSAIGSLPSVHSTRAVGAV